MADAAAPAPARRPWRKLLAFLCPLFIFSSFLLLFRLHPLPQLLPAQLFSAWKSQFSQYIILQQNVHNPYLHTNTVHPFPNGSPQISDPNASRVAVCLVGGARAFELTGPSIKKYLLRANSFTDVFVHAPLDKDSHKLSLLKDVPNLVQVRIFTPQRLLEPAIFREVLTASNSPNGIQGLLQYFNLVEGCVHMIEQYQLEHRFRYDWIIRTRLDGYWNGHLPSLHKMDHTAYIVPLGSQFGGLNDRLGIGDWETSKAALSRLSLIPTLHEHGFRGLNSETSFKRQLEVCNVTYKFEKFPFCILSHRSYGWPPGQWGVPVLSISSKGPLNGAKCRPCSPVVIGEAARSILEATVRSWSWTGSLDGPELCNPTNDWEADWEGIFDKVAGPESQGARREFQNKTLADCIEDVEAFKKQVWFWDAPPPSTICKKVVTF